MSLSSASAPTDGQAGLTTDENPHEMKKTKLEMRMRMGMAMADSDLIRYTCSGTCKCNITKRDPSARQMS